MFLLQLLRRLKHVTPLSPRIGQALPYHCAFAKGFPLLGIPIVFCPFDKPFFYFPRPSSGVSILGSLSPLEQVNVVIFSSRVPWDSTQMQTTVFQYFVCPPVQLLKGRDRVIFIFVPPPYVKHSAWYKVNAQIKIYQMS